MGFLNSGSLFYFGSMESIQDFQQPYLSIKDWVADDRPREKFLTKGRQTLADAELIALLLGTGCGKKNVIDLAREILAFFQSDLDLLGKATIPELTRIKGIGEAKAVLLSAALELGRRRRSQTSAKQPQIRSSYEAWEAFRHFFDDLQHEEFRVVLLNRANRVIHQSLIGVGGVSATIADPRKILRPLLDYQASGLLLLHNHPSGQREASSEDKNLTNRIKSLCGLLDAQLIDHLIFVKNGYLSFSDEQLL